MELLVFALDGHRFAVAVAHIREIVRAVALSPLPGAPAFVEGIANVRGTPVPVFDLRRRFDLRARAIAIGDFLILLRAGGRDAAFRVDEVVGVRRVEEGAVVDPRSIVARSRYIAGLAELDDGIVFIQDPAAFLTETESEDLERAMAVEAVT